MASHCHPHHCHHQNPPPPSISTHCCCNSNPSYTCCSPPPPPPDQHVKAIASLLSQSHPIPTHLYTQNQYQNYHPRHPLHQHQYHQEQQIHSAIASLLCRIEALESSLNNHSHRSSCSLRDAAARVIQSHFRAFLVRRSRTLRHLKHLGFIKTSFSALKSSFSNEKIHLDFPALSHNAVDLLLQLDSIEDGDPMIRDGKRSISRDLVQFLDAIEGVAVKRHLRYVKAAQNMRFGEKVNKSRALNSRHVNSSDDDKRKLLQNLRGRVEKISRLCKVSENDDQDSEPEGIHHVVVDDDDGGPNSVSISRRNGIFVQRQGVQPRAKKSVSFSENGNISKVYNSTYEPVLSGDVTCLDGNSSSDDQGEVLGNVSIEVEDVMDSSQRAEDDEEAPVDDGGSPHSSDGERNSRRDLKNDGRNILKGHREKLLFSAPLPLKMENRAELMKSKGVRIVT